MAEPQYPLLALSRLRMGIDGPGVTTLIAGAGCPLHCRWCINKRLLREAKPVLVTASELLDQVKCDDLYFRATGGGVCFGGGEALLHAPFIRRFRETCPGEWRISVETSLAVEPSLVQIAAECADGFIVDCKDTKSSIYRQYTGGDAARMLENLRLLLCLVGPERVTVRVPLIPGFNTAEDQARSVGMLKKMGVRKLDIFTYECRENE